MNKYFKCQWNTEDIDYELEIIPFGTEPLSECEIVAFTKMAIIEIEELKSKYEEDYPVGTTAIGSCSIKFDLLECPKELQNILIVPYKKTTLNYLTFSKEILIGNAINLYEIENEERKLLFSGTQKPTIERLATSDINEFITLELTFINSISYAMLLIDSNTIAEVMRLEAKNETIYSLFTRGAYNALFVDAVTETEPNFLLMFKFSDLDIVISNLVKAVLSILYRQEVNFFFDSNYFTAITFYRQYTESPNKRVRDEALPFNELLFVGASSALEEEDFPVQNDNFDYSNYQTGFFIKNENEPFTTLHEFENAWDYYKAMTKTYFCKGTTNFRINNNQLEFSLQFRKIFEAESIKSITGHDILIDKEVELTLSASIVNRIVCNLKAYDYDIDGAESNSSFGSLADKDIEIKSIFHNVLAPWTSKSRKHVYKKYPNYWYGNTFSHDYTGDNTDVNCIYCLSVPQQSETQIGLIAEAVTVSNGLDVWENEMSLTGLFPNDPVIWLEAQKNNLYSVIAKAYMETFSNINQIIWDLNADVKDLLYPSEMNRMIEFEGRYELLIQMIAGDDNSSHPYAIFSEILKAFATNPDDSKKLVVPIDLNYSIEKGTVSGKLFIKGY